METTLLYRLFVECMAAFSDGRQAAMPALSAQEWGKLYALAKRQSLSGALFTAVSHADMPDTVRDRLRRDAFLTLSAYETQRQAYKDIAACLDAAQVPHVFFKGAAVRRYYPDPAMRSMGDIDAAVHAADRERADRALLATGFERSSQSTEVWVYTRDGAMLELHTAVRRYHVGKQTTETYDGLWTDVRQKAGMTYHLSDEAEAAYAIGHMAAHFCSGGCGLRQLMDVAMLYKRFPDEAMWQGVLRCLKDCQTESFARHVLWLCGEWFGLEMPAALISPLDDETQQGMLQRLLADGTFGTNERLLLARVRRERRLGKSGGALGAAVRWAFPSARELRRRYGYANKHLWLLPAAYIHRLADGATKNRRIHAQRLHYADEQKDELERELVLFEKLGL